MKKQICIVGSGTSGLQLAYALRDAFQVTVTLILQKRYVLDEL
ncbi:NAD(P)-binding protein [Fictibacillus sp. 7GRE50]|nr:NAD(P)-binding protein [Fictibacillus sp. 7GRE50]MBH0165596.1 NAD(P)-binding protein [Fictibacillus sp. 7GRE50]